MVKALAASEDVKTLAIDIGGSGIKMMVLDGNGSPLSERLRQPTPPDPTPKRMLAVLEQMKQQLPEFDRVSVGFPGVIKQGKTMTAVNIHPKWLAFPLEKTIADMWKKPTRLCNDAAVQGYGAISGKGVELILTLGTGLGSALFSDGHLCPGLEMGHHPWHKKTYEDYLGRRGLEKYGKKKWNKLFTEAVVDIRRLFNWDCLYIGGGNASKLTSELPKDARIVSNQDGLLGGVALWRDE